MISNSHHLFQNTGIKVFDKFSLSALQTILIGRRFLELGIYNGTYPKILQDKTVGKAAKQIFKDAKAMLKKLLKKNGFMEKLSLEYGQLDQKMI